MFPLICCSYNKTENLLPGGADMMSFSHLLVGTLSENHSELAPYSSSHTILATVPAYSGLSFSWKQFPFFHIKTKPAIWILKKIEPNS